MQAQPGLLHDVLGLSGVAQHPRGDPDQPRPFRLEGLRHIHHQHPSSNDQALRALTYAQQRL